jgi:hypothetical protein
MILKPLQKIQVINSSKMCKGGSLGYFIAQEPASRYNTWNMSILFTRFGKAGKPRLYLMSVNTFMINYAALPKTDKTIIDTVKFYEDLEPRSYINTSVGDTLLEPIPVEHKNLLDLVNNEFTAYIIALSLFIRKLTNLTSVVKLHHMPALVFGEFVNNGSNLASIDSSRIGYYILHGLRLRDDERKIGIEDGRGKLFAESYAERIDSEVGRRELLSKLHMSLAMSKNVFIKYDKLVFGCFGDVAARINDILKYYRRNERELNFIKKDEDIRTENIAKSDLNKDAKIPRKRRMKIRRAL